MSTLIFGDKKSITSTKFDVENFNIFYFVQKTHIAVLEIYHLALTENQEDNISVINSRDKIIDELLKNLGEVSRLVTEPILPSALGSGLYRKKSPLQSLQTL